MIAFHLLLLISNGKRNNLHLVNYEDYSGLGLVVLCAVSVNVERKPNGIQEGRTNVDQHSISSSRKFVECMCIHCIIYFSTFNPNNVSSVCHSPLDFGPQQHHNRRTSQNCFSFSLPIPPCKRQLSCRNILPLRAHT